MRVLAKTLACGRRRTCARRFGDGAGRQAADDPGVGAGPELPVLRPHDEPDEGGGRSARQHHRHRVATARISTPKQTADVETAITQGVDGIVISPNEVDAMAPAHPAGGRCRHPGRHHRPPRRQGAGHPGPCRRRQRQGRRGAGRADHEALPGRRDDHQPAGHARREPRDRPQQGPAQRARQGSRTSTSSSSSRPPTSAAPTACRSPNRRSPAWTAPPDVIVAGNDDMALGAIEALKAPQHHRRRRRSASTRCPRRWPRSATAR